MSNTQPRTNQFLASLSSADYARLAPRLRPIGLEQGTLLYEPGDEIKQVYFPQTGMISLLRVMRNGKAIETATVGHEGAIGIMAGLGAYTTLSQATVQLPLTGMQIAAVPFRKAVHESAALQT